MEYTFEMLLDDICDIPNRVEDKADSINKEKREWQPKLIIMQMLIALASKYGPVASYNEEENVRKALEVEVNNDELLSGYAFFVSLNQQFDYTWSYMRKQKKCYVEFLANAIIFLKNLLVDINTLGSNAQGMRDAHFVFNDIFDVAFIAESPHVKIRVQWENFYRIATIRKCYNVMAKTGAAVLVVRDRENVSDMVDIKNEVLQKIGNKTNA